MNFNHFLQAVYVKKASVWAYCMYVKASLLTTWITGVQTFSPVIESVSIAPTLIGNHCLALTLFLVEVEIHVLLLAVVAGFSIISIQ